MKIRFLNNLKYSINFTLIRIEFGETFFLFMFWGIGFEITKDKKEV